MKMNLVVRENASESILTILIWSVASLLTTRLYLSVMGYPQIGGGDWHVSHAATGGLIMVIGVIMMIIFAGKNVKRNSLVIFGIGLGWFVDEIGKFLTEDNNYFFQPAIIFMYVFFVCLFLLYRYLKRFEIKDNRAIFYSVLNRLEELADNDLEKSEKKYIVNTLNKIVKTEKINTIKIMAMGMIESLQKIEPKTDRRKGEWRRMVGQMFQVTYDKIFRRKLVMIGLWIYSIYYAIDKIGDIFRITTSSQKMMMIERFNRDYNFFGKSDIYMIVGKMIFDLVAAIFFLAGARYFWSKKRLRGIRFFKYGLYVSLLLSSIFRFYFEQFGAMVELVMWMIMLEVLNQYRKEVVK